MKDQDKLHFEKGLHYMIWLRAELDSKISHIQFQERLRTATALVKETSLRWAKQWESSINSTYVLMILLLDLKTSSSRLSQ